MKQTGADGLAIPVCAQNAGNRMGRRRQERSRRLAEFTMVLVAVISLTVRMAYRRAALTNVALKTKSQASANGKTMRVIPRRLNIFLNGCMKYSLQNVR